MSEAVTVITAVGIAGLLGGGVATLREVTKSTSTWRRALAGIGAALMIGGLLGAFAWSPRAYEAFCTNP